MNKWFVIPKPNSKAKLRIFCFPYAGGNISSFYPWIEKLNSNAELVLIHLPGRTTRFFEESYSSMDSLVNELVRIMPFLLDKPYVLFGHSLGSRVAFELVNQFTKLNIKLPIHFIASGSEAPSEKKCKETITYNLPDKEFIKELEDLGGTPKELLENKELLDICLPALRADFQIAETYLFTNKVTFNIPLLIIGGSDDIEYDKLILWQQFFQDTASVCIIPGDHFFIDSSSELTLNEVNKVIERTYASDKVYLSSH
ncbi:MAG: medium-chain acyl-[acyl-carrier-protein] hydrolase [Francisellaceae bacterium]|jgi:medium-chain acyl-[acyl-carrier-protein] hydrolase